jgi:hypothetical protein
MSLVAQCRSSGRVAGGDGNKKLHHQSAHNTMILTPILLFTLAACAGSVAVASLSLAIPGKTRSIFVPCCVSSAAGTPLGAAFLGRRLIAR